MEIGRKDGGGATELIIGPSHVLVGRNYTHALLGLKSDKYVTGEDVDRGPTLDHHSSPFKHKELSVCAAGWRLLGLLCELQTHHLDVYIIDPVSSFVV